MNATRLILLLMFASSPMAMLEPEPTATFVISEGTKHMINQDEVEGAAALIPSV